VNPWKLPIAAPIADNGCDVETRPIHDHLNARGRSTPNTCSGISLYLHCHAAMIARKSQAVPAQPHPQIPQFQNQP